MGSVLCMNYLILRTLPIWKQKTKKGEMEMIELGKKDEIFGTELLIHLKTYQVSSDFSGRPDKMPYLDEKKQERVIAGYDQGLGERMLVCETLEDMQMLYDKYTAGWAITLNWYKGEDPGFISII